MFEPLQELLLASRDGGRVSLRDRSALGSAVLEDSRLLGEKDGRLFGSSEQDEYAARGGAVYATHRFVNDCVAGWGRSSGKGDGDGGRGRAALRRRAIRRGGPRGIIVYVAGLCAALPRGLARASLTTAAYVFPGLRVLVPSAVPRPNFRRQLLATTASAAPERVVAVAFHPYQVLLAVAVDEGGADGSARVTVYDAARGAVVRVLTHAFQKDVQALSWKPWSLDVLAVGCRGGVLVWRVGGGAAADGASVAQLGAAASSSSPSSPSSGPADAFALFYRCSRRLPVTSLAFSNENGRYLACGSRWTARLTILDVSSGPQEPASVVCSIVASVEGGCEQVLFADDDAFAVAAVAAAPYLSLVQTRQFPYTSKAVATPAPVLQMESAGGVGANYFFLYTRALEGVLLARIDGATGVEVVSMISTALCRGVGGAVRRIAASRRRLWVALETGHLLVAHYNCREGHLSLIPIGIAAADVQLLTHFPGCETGSLVSVVDRDGTISLLPSYHV